MSPLAETCKRLPDNSYAVGADLGTPFFRLGRKKGADRRATFRGVFARFDTEEPADGIDTELDMRGG
tara:strand:+ start:296 stop:496 length:201 start_codon:yes stop_codon:yes gene_type:complete